MSTPKSQWGIFFCALAISMVVGAVWLFITYASLFRAPLFTTVIPAIGIIMSVLAFVIGHVSYPRVQNLKVYLSGFLVGTIGLAYFTLSGVLISPSAQAQSAGFVVAMSILAMLNIALIVFVPSQNKYRTVRIVATTITIVEVLLIFVLRTNPQLLSWAIPFLTMNGIFDLRFLLGMLWCGAIITLSIWRMRREFYLGGIFTGCAILYFCIWSTFSYAADGEYLRTILHATVPLFYVIGTIVHWFTRMEHRASYDPLLHIYNRDYCTRVITEQSNLDVRAPCGIGMVDIDHFKNVNDTYGHHAGDLVLTAVAQMVQTHLGETGVVCRYGGEELIIFFPHMVTKELMASMETLRLAIEKMVVPAGDKKISVTISVGVSHRESLAQSIVDVIKAADSALYKAKEGGRNQVRLQKCTGGTEESAGEGSAKKAKKKVDGEKVKK